MKPEMRRALANQTFEEKIRKVSQLIRLTRAVPRPVAKDGRRNDTHTTGR